MSVEVAKFVTGPIETNTYVVVNEQKRCLIIDPSKDCARVGSYLTDNNITPAAIVLTHGHFDHILGVPELLKAYPTLEVWMHPGEKELVENPGYNGAFLIGSDFSFAQSFHQLHEGVMSIAGFDCTVFHIPGHTPGGCAIIIDGKCFSGDALFAGSVGRSDFAFGDHEALIKNIREKLMTLPDTTPVYPGHGGRTTIAREKRHNPFLQE
jgi:hydroxyacylglutathione hydrolase